LFKQFFDQLFPPKPAARPDDLMKSLRSPQSSGEKLETLRILGVSSFSPGIYRLLRDFTKPSGLTANSGGKS
jgi:hypothetical protein